MLISAWPTSLRWATALRVLVVEQHASIREVLNMVLGSVATKVLAECTTPVLIVR